VQRADEPGCQPLNWLAAVPLKGRLVCLLGRAEGFRSETGLR